MMKMSQKKSKKELKIAIKIKSITEKEEELKDGVKELKTVAFFAKDKMGITYSLTIKGEPKNHPFKNIELPENEEYDLILKAPSQIQKKIDE